MAFDDAEEEYKKIFLNVGRRYQEEMKLGIKKVFKKKERRKVFIKEPSCPS